MLSSLWRRFLPAKSKAVVFWDMENVEPTKNVPLHVAVRRLRTFLSTLGFESPGTTARAPSSSFPLPVPSTPDDPPVRILAFASPHNLSVGVRNSLEREGVELVDGMGSGRNSADLGCMVSMFSLLFPIPPSQTPHTHIFLIASDSDYSTPLRAVRSRGFPVTLVHCPQPAQKLVDAATGTVETGYGEYWGRPGEGKTVRWEDVLEAGRDTARGTSAGIHRTHTRASVDAVKFRHGGANRHSWAGEKGPPPAFLADWGLVDSKDSGYGGLTGGVRSSPSATQSGRDKRVRRVARRDNGNMAVQVP